MGNDGLDLCEMNHYTGIKSQIYGMLGGTVLFWTRSIKECEEFIQKGITSGKEYGNLLWTNYCASMYSLLASFSSLNAITYRKHLLKTIHEAEKSNCQEVIITQKIHLQMLGMLQGEGWEFDFDRKMVRDFPRQTIIYVVAKLKTNCLLKDYKQGMIEHEENSNYFNPNPEFTPTPSIVEYYLYLGLLCLKILTIDPSWKKSLIKSSIKKSIKQFKKLGNLIAC